MLRATVKFPRIKENLLPYLLTSELTGSCNINLNIG